MKEGERWHVKEKGQTKRPKKIKVGRDAETDKPEPIQPVFHLIEDVLEK